MRFSMFSKMQLIYGCVNFKEKKISIFLVGSRLVSSCSDHFLMYANVEFLCCTPDTNTECQL